MSCRRLVTVLLAGLTALIAALVLAAPATAAPATAAPATAASAAGPTPVAAVDLSRYVGSWYQVAAIPQLFEIQCAGNVTATYAAQSDGTVGVLNRCRTWIGTTSSVTGRARVENAPANSVLTVSFVKLFGHWLYFGGPNYEIVGLDPDYRWAVVVSPDLSSAFVLSRTPALSPADTAAVQADLRANGVDPCRLSRTKQAGGDTGGGAFC